MQHHKLKDKEQIKLYESEPFGNEPLDHRQQEINRNIKTSTSNETSTYSNAVPFKHSTPQSRVFLHGLKAGQFTHQGEVNNMAECIQYCGHQSNCSAAFMVRNFCFTVQCYSKKSCDTTPAVHSEFNPKLAFVTHFSPPMTSRSGTGFYFHMQYRAHIV